MGEKSDREADPAPDFFDEPAQMTEFTGGSGKTATEISESESLGAESLGAESLGAESLADDSLRAETSSAASGDAGGAETESSSRSRNRDLSSTGGMNELLGYVLKNYLSISIKLISSPRRFFEEIEAASGIQEAGAFLLTSAALNAILTAIIKLKPLTIPGTFIMESSAACVLAGLVYMLSKGMGSKCSFQTVFKVFAYCSCMQVLAPVQGVGVLSGVLGLVLAFFGLKTVLKVNLYQTITIMFLLCFFQVILNLGRMMQH